MHSAEFLGVPPTGRRIETDVIEIWRVEDDKIVEHWGGMTEVSERLYRDLTEERP